MARGGWKLSEETRRKMSESRKGMRLSEEAKEKLRAARTGKPLSAEHRAKLAAAKIGKPGPWAGKKRGPVSEETRAKMSAAKKGKSPSAEHRAALSAALMGHEVSEETRAKMKGRVVSAETRKMLSEIGLKIARRGPANNRWGKPPAHGKRIEHKGHVFRSSYEVRCADALDRKGIKWEYEPRRFDLGDCTYLPDFYLPEQGVYWEVKGWLDPRSQRKINRFREVHPDIPLVVVTNTVLKLMEA